MADDVARLLIQVSATTELLRSNLNKAEAAVASFERDTNKRLGRIDKSFSGLGKGVGAIKGALAGFAGGAFAGFLASFSVGTITNAISQSLEFAGSLGEVAQSLGVSTKFLQEFRYAATQNGATVEQADNALGKFSVTLGKAFSSGQSAAIKQLGLNLEELKRASDSERYAAVAAAIAKIPDPAQRASAAVAIFGKGATAIIPTLEAGAEGFRRQAKEAREFGLVLSDKQIQDADKTADKIDRLTSALGTRFAGVVADNATEIGEFAESIADLVDKIIGFEKYYPRFAAAIKSFSPISGGLIGSAIRGDGLFTDTGPAPKRRSRPASNADFLKTSTPSSLGNGANFLNASPGRLGAGGALALSGIDFGTVLEQFRATVPLVDAFASHLQSAAEAQSEIGRDGQTYLADLRESNRLALLRAEGRDDEADAVEAMARVADQVNSIEGLTVAQRQKLLILASQLTLEGLRQADSAKRRLDLEREYQDELTGRTGQSMGVALEGIDAMVETSKAMLNEYADRAKQANAAIADNFEILFTQGTKGLWRQFEYDGIRAVSQVLANLLTGQSAFGGGGGGFFGSLFSAVGSIFGGGGGSLGKSTSNILGRASGGPVNAGQPYIVGEKRAELFVPRTPGSIVPSLKGMGGQAINLTVNAPGATAETVALIRRELANAAPTIAAAASNMTMRNISRPRL